VSAFYGYLVARGDVGVVNLVLRGCRRVPPIWVSTIPEAGALPTGGRRCRHSVPSAPIRASDCISSAARADALAISNVGVLSLLEWAGSIPVHVEAADVNPGDVFVNRIRLGLDGWRRERRPSGEPEAAPAQLTGYFRLPWINEEHVRPPSDHTS